MRQEHLTIRKRAVIGLSGLDHQVAQTGEAPASAQDTPDERDTSRALRAAL